MATRRNIKPDDAPNDPSLAVNHSHGGHFGYAASIGENLPSFSAADVKSMALAKRAAVQTRNARAKTRARSSDAVDGAAVDTKSAANATKASAQRMQRMVEPTRSVDAGRANVDKMAKVNKAGIVDRLTRGGKQMAIQGRIDAPFDTSKIGKLTKAGEGTVNIGDLKQTQRTVSVDKVKAKLNSVLADTEKPVPVYRNGKDLYVLDGNHGLEARKALGIGQTKAVFYEGAHPPPMRVQAGPGMLERAGGFGNVMAKAATPLAVAGGASQAYNAFNDAKAHGGSNVDAAMAGAKAAAPTATGLTAGYALARLAPSVARLAGPIGLAAAGAKAIYDGYQGYEKNGVEGAIRGAADSLTFGLAGKGFDAAEHFFGHDPVTQGIVDQAASKNNSAPKLSKFAADQAAQGNDIAPRVEARFDAANQQYEQGQQQRGPDMQAQPESPAKRKGWGNQARINAAIARGANKIPYQGDPMQGPEQGQPSENQKGAYA